MKTPHCYSQKGCCKCDGMKQSGIIAIVLLVIFFWPLAFIPCLMDECFEVAQLAFSPVKCWIWSPRAVQPLVSNHALHIDWSFVPGFDTSLITSSSCHSWLTALLCCHALQPQQRPVYGFAPGQGPLPVAEPVQGRPVQGQPVYEKATQPPV